MSFVLKSSSSLGNLDDFVCLLLIFYLLFSSVRNLVKKLGSIKTNVQNPSKTRTICIQRFSMESIIIHIARRWSICGIKIARTSCTSSSFPKRRLSTSGIWCNYYDVPSRHSRTKVVGRQVFTKDLGQPGSKDAIKSVSSIRIYVDQKQEPINSSISSHIMDKTWLRLIHSPQTKRERVGISLDPPYDLELGLFHLPFIQVQRLWLSFVYD